MSGHTDVSSNFYKTLEFFCNDLQLTFPELDPVINRAKAVVTPSFYWRSWQNYLDVLEDENVEDLFVKRRGILFAPIQLSIGLWGEISEDSHQAIWRYLRILLLEALMEMDSNINITAEQSAAITSIMTQERIAIAEESNDISEGYAAMEDMSRELFGEAGKGIVERLQKILQSTLPVDISGSAAVIDSSGNIASTIPPLPEIPERLRNGKIMKLIQSMANQFNPEDFGISHAFLVEAGDNVEKVLQYMAELYQRNPAVIIAGAKRMGERIQKQIMGGTIKQEELIAEAREFVELFKDHPLFKGAIEKFQEMVGEGGLAEMMGGLGGGGSAGAPSERLRTVQERLRKKMAARAAKK